MNQIKTKSTLLLACGLVLVALPGAFAAHPGDRSPDAMFKAMDTNNDGKASRAEHAAAAQKMFTETDTNQDGRVALADTQAAHAKVQADHAKMNADMPMKADRPMSADMQMKSDKTMKMEMAAAEMIKKCDKNGDGEVSSEEHLTHADEMFTKMDTDGDGFLSGSECTAGHEAMMKDKKSAK